MISLKNLGPSAAAYVADRTISVMRSQGEASRQLNQNPFIKMAEVGRYEGVKRVIVKRIEDWQELNSLWLRSGMMGYSRKIMWNGVPIVAAWDACQAD